MPAGVLSSLGLSMRIRTWSLPEIASMISSGGRGEKVMRKSPGRAGESGQLLGRRARRRMLIFWLKQRNMGSGSCAAERQLSKQNPGTD